MTPRFANSAFVNAPEWLMQRDGHRRRTALRVRYGICRHPRLGLTLIDTGYGPRVTLGPRGRALRLYSRLLAPRLVAEGQPQPVLHALGATPAEVETVILTHFHADHVAALDQFPQACIYTRRHLFERIMARTGWRNLRHGIFIELLPASMSERIVDIESLPRVRAPGGLGMAADLGGDGQMLAIDLPGHAEGHFGICFAALQVPLLYAADVQWLPGALPALQQPGWPATLIADDRHAAAASSARVAAFGASGGAVLLCHDPQPGAFDLPEMGR